MGCKHLQIRRLDAECPVMGAPSEPNSKPIWAGGRPDDRGRKLASRDTHDAIRMASHAKQSQFRGCWGENEDAMREQSQSARGWPPPTPPGSGAAVIVGQSLSFPLTKHKARNRLAAVWVPAPDRVEGRLCAGMTRVVGEIALFRGRRAVCSGALDLVRIGRIELYGHCG